MHPYVHSSAIYNSQDLETAWMPISTWVDEKHWYIYILEYYVAVKKKEFWPFYNSMDETRDYYSKWIKSVSERQTQYDLTCKWNLMNKIN